MRQQDFLLLLRRTQSVFEALTHKINIYVKTILVRWNIGELHIKVPKGDEGELDG